MFSTARAIARSRRQLVTSIHTPMQTVAAHTANPVAALSANMDLSAPSENTAVIVVCKAKSDTSASVSPMLR